MIVATSPEEWNAWLERGACVLVPTMGALHAGHAALVRLGAQLARERGLAAGCVATVFVNPTQFNEKSDFERYPRTLDADAALCAEAGASMVVAPAPGHVYPPGRVVPTPALPRVATAPGLEDAHRPGHFAGVCQVVSRLFEMFPCAAAVFGEKDWQQLQVVRAMTHDLKAEIEIVPGATIREADGLAMSSRNRFLSDAERAAGRAIRAALDAARAERDPHAAEARMAGVLRDAGLEIDYAVVRDAETLERLDPGSGRSGRALITARAGSVRLLDNDAWPA
ncbi:MAG: pantoate--beta-alanine ligase [Phycisphaerales bacterium]|nr:pantoate--beta-alanine ligase [Phycisphaerales bacterium]